MMDCLIVWAALGPILAFIAGAVVVAWWDDEEEDLASRDRRGPARRGVFVPGQALSFDPHGHGWVGWERISGMDAGDPLRRAAASCLQCGRKEPRP